MSRVLRSMLVTIAVIAAGCGGPFGGLPLTSLGLPFANSDDFFDFAFSTPTSIPGGVYTGTFDIKTTIRVSDDVQVTESSMNAITREFGPSGEPLLDGNRILSGAFGTENGGVTIQFDFSFPIDHPFVEPFDLSMVATETMELNPDGTLNYTATATGMTFDEFVLVTTELTGTLSK